MQTANSTQSDEQFSQGLTRSVFWIGMIYALIGVINYTIWALFGEADGVRNRVPIDLLPFFGILVLVMAVNSDMGQKTLKISLTSLERTCLIIAVVALLVGMLFISVEMDRSIDGLMIKIPHIALAISLYYLLCQAGRTAALWMTAAIAMQTFLHMPIVAALYLTNVDNTVVNWLGGPIGYWHVRIWGMLLAAGLAAALGIYAARPIQGPLLHLVAGVVFIVLWTALFWSGTRSGAVGLIAATLVSLVLLPSAFLRCVPLFLATAAVAGGLSVMLTVPLDAYGLLQALGGRDNGLEGVNALSGGRMQMWTGTLGQLTDQPIFGHGLDQFILTAEAGKSHVQPHNAILQLLFDFGLVGGGAALILIASLWLRAITPVVRERQAWKYGAMTALHAMMAISMFDGVIYHHDPLIVVMICFGILFSTPKSGLTQAVKAADGS